MRGRRPTFARSALVGPVGFVGSGSSGRVGLVGLVWSAWSGRLVWSAHRVAASPSEQSLPRRRLTPALPGPSALPCAAPSGYYVEACFMDTQDGREHTQLGMERLVQIVP